MKKILTISIPTYNRQKQLLRLLHSIDIQDCIDLYKIQILDNNSSYSIEECINSCFSQSFINNIEILHRNTNGGGDYNIASSFCYVDTELMWLIGDDDETLPGSIKSIVRRYKENPDIAFFKYPATSSINVEEDIILNSVEDLKKCYRNKLFYPGDLIYLSNNVYNVERVRKYFSDCLYYCYCSAPHTIPFLRTLLTPNEKAMFCKDVVVKYNAPDGDHWNYVKIVTSFGTFLDIAYGKKYKEVADFFYIMCDHFGTGQFLLDCLAIKDRQFRIYIYRKAIFSVFARKKKPQDYLARFLFLFEHYSRIPLMSKMYGFLYNKQNDIKVKLKKQAERDEKTKRLVLFLKKYMPKLK